MFTVELDGKTFQVEKTGHQYLIDGEIFYNDLQMRPGKKISVMVNQKPVWIEWLDSNAEEKKIILMVNGKKTDIVVKNPLDVLLQKMGFDQKDSHKSSQIKAPMPGMVLHVLTTEGSSVRKGDGIVILEAMKMENMLKATADGIIQKILVSPTDKVEKNQVLIEMV